MHEVNWDERYQGEAEQRPWDNGVVEPELIRCMETDLAGANIKRAMEIGCGTGTNAIWLAERGVDVLGTEISPTAIALADKGVAGKSLPIRFVENNIVETPPVQPASIDFAFDRGVFHVMSAQDRVRSSKTLRNRLWTVAGGCAWRAARMKRSQRIEVRPGLLPPNSWRRLKRSLKFSLFAKLFSNCLTERSMRHGRCYCANAGNV